MTRLQELIDIVEGVVLMENEGPSRKPSRNPSMEKMMTTTKMKLEGRLYTAGAPIDHNPETGDIADINVGDVVIADGAAWKYDGWLPSGGFVLLRRGQARYVDLDSQALNRALQRAVEA